jgi:DNA-directed RNA polymerase specialized sigma24 family protein
MTDDDYEVFFRSTYPKLVAYGASMSAPLGIAQELAQETLLRAYRRLEEVSGLESPYADDLSVADVAIELAISTGSVKSTLSQVRRRLGRLLDDTTENEEICHGH